MVKQHHANPVSSLPSTISAFLTWASVSLMVARQLPLRQGSHHMVSAFRVPGSGHMTVPGAFTKARGMKPSDWSGLELGVKSLFLRTRWTQMWGSVAAAAVTRGGAAW